MKGDFVVKFIEAVAGAYGEMRGTWNARPIYYKGFRVNGYSKNKFQSGINNLKHRRFITGNNDSNYRFTQEGRMWFEKSLLRYYRLNHTKWDKKWRVVIFDIPQELHRERNNFRKKLKSLGFHMLQKSVFVFPFPCESEIAPFCQKLKISDYVNVIIADSLGSMDTEAKKLFKLY